MSNNNSDENNSDNDNSDNEFEFEYESESEGFNSDDFEDDFSVSEKIVDQKADDKIHETFDGDPDGLPQRSLTAAEKAFIGNSSSMAVTRIMKDRRELGRATDYLDYFEIDIEDDNIHIWKVTMRFPEKEKLQKALDSYAESSENHPNGIKMELTFPSDFPMAPPFMRVISPRFKFHTGRVTIGGSICTELLTSQGWMPTYSVGQALIQVQSEILGGNPDLEPYSRYQAEYSKQEAMEAFMRVARQKGWEK